MSLYANAQLETMRARYAVNEWCRSEVISADLRDRLLDDLPTGLRWTRLILRAVLFGAAILLVVSIHLWAGEFFEELLGDVPPFFLASAVYAALAEYAVRRFRLYRYGVEEALALAAIAYAAIGVFETSQELGWSARLDGWIDDPSLVLALTTAGALALVVHRRFTMVPAAVLSQASLAGALLLADPPGARLLVSLIFGGSFAWCLLRARSLLHEHGEFTYRLLTATSLCGVYVGFSLEAVHQQPATGWVMILLGLMSLTGAAGVAVAIRERDRILLNVGAALTLLTIVTGKAYLQWPIQPWGGIEVGAAMIVVAVLLRRWIAAGPNGERHGFTAKRLLTRDSLAFTAATFAAPVLASAPLAPRTEPGVEGPTLGGGRSGGGGATGQY